MKKAFRQYFTIISLLVGSSLLLYFIHYLVFGNLSQTVSGVILSMAYVPIGIFYNLLIVDKFMEKRDKIESQKKMNVLVGSFYHEVGTTLLEIITKGDETIDEISGCCMINSKWTDESFNLLSETLQQYECIIDLEKIDLEKLKNFLDNKDGFILDILISPIVNEYDELSSMLIALLHLRDELVTRNYEHNLKEYEKNHIKKDICRAYMALLDQWVDYMKILKGYYPALFTKALINSPFDRRNQMEKDMEYLNLSRKDVEK